MRLSLCTRGGGCLNTPINNHFSWRTITSKNNKSYTITRPRFINSTPPMWNVRSEKRDQTATMCISIISMVCETIYVKLWWGKGFVQFSLRGENNIKYIVSQHIYEFKEFISKAVNIQMPKYHLLFMPCSERFQLLPWWFAYVVIFPVDIIFGHISG